MRTIQVRPSRNPRAGRSDGTGKFTRLKAYGRLFGFSRFRGEGGSFSDVQYRARAILGSEWKSVTPRITDRVTVSPRKVFGSADHSGADRTSDRAGAARA